MNIYSHALQSLNQAAADTLENMLVKSRKAPHPLECFLFAQSLIYKAFRS